VGAELRGITAIGFTVPFLAYLPTEHLGGSGLVAAVVAGIVAGQGGQRWFTPEQRLSDEVNWRTVELVLEGGIFLIMGLELDQIVRAVTARHEGIALPTAAALVALAIVLVVRAGYVAFILWVGRTRVRGTDRARLESMDARMEAIAENGWPRRGPDDADLPHSTPAGRLGQRRANSPARAERRLTSMRHRISRSLADLDYYQSTPLGWKHGTVIVWAGMRGVVTLAAAQTIPRTIDTRPELVYIAFVVALVSLLLQGFSLPWLVRRLQLTDPGSGPEADDSHALDAGAARRRDSRAHLGRPAPPRRLGVRRRDRRPSRLPLHRSPRREVDELRSEVLELRLALIEAMRTRLNRVASGGRYATATLRHTMSQLDADQLSIELRLREDE
jgi:CPA1 family monovalent cation:H+ antiporter